MKFTDLVMCAGDDAQTELHCHRAVLAKSSEVFDRMLSTMAAMAPEATVHGDIMGIDTGNVGSTNSWGYHEDYWDTMGLVICFGIKN